MTIKDVPAFPAMDISPARPATPPRCRCCGSADVRERGTKLGKRIPRTFHYYHCLECSFLFVEPVTDPSIYDDDYYDGRGIDPAVNYREEYENYATTPRASEFEDFARLAADHFSRAGGTGGDRSKKSWLDFGCGAGGLLKFLRARGGYRVTGHDIGSYADRLKHDDGFEILDWDELQALPTASFDVITCIEVLEHVPEPRPLIELMARLLRPGGLLILTTGNLDCAVARWQGLNFPYVVPEIHVSLFNPHLLQKLYTEAGLKPLHVRYRGSIQFRIRKNLQLNGYDSQLGWLAKLPPAVWLADRLWGTSAMPCATKLAPDAENRAAR